jgi:hypothetical protein
MAFSLKFIVALRWSPPPVGAVSCIAFPYDGSVIINTTAQSEAIMPGPRPTPTPLKIIRGNPSKRPIRAEPEPTVPAELPEAPGFLNGYARDEWYRIGEELRAFQAGQVATSLYQGYL